MFKYSFRDHHLLEMLSAYEQQTLPLDYFINTYFRQHKALGSKDRGYIAESLYSIIRWRGLLEYLCEKPHRWPNVLEFWKQFRPSDYIHREDIPLHVRVSFPRFLFELLVANYGTEKTVQLALDSNKPAPTTIRANSLKTQRDFLLNAWKDLYSVAPCHFAPQGIVFKQKMNFFNLPEFKDGLFEVQDEGSQLLAGLVQAEPGQLVMDYCAGSGGKTLAFAPAMNNTGQIYLHDVRKHALEESRKRLRRAGIQNAQIAVENDPKLKKLKKHMDWVLVDAPCSGTGTLRRNPDMKWKFSEDMLKRLVGQQRVIFEKALSFLKPTGRIVYATCSLLAEENQNQLAHFLKTYPLVLENEPFQSLPEEGGMDGFFGAVFKLQADDE